MIMPWRNMIKLWKKYLIYHKYGRFGGGIVNFVEINIAKTPLNKGKIAVYYYLVVFLLRISENTV